MRRLKDFRCNQCKKTYERFVSEDVTTMPCDCGGIAEPVIGLPTIKLEGITGDFPGAHDRWARIREENARIKAKRDN